MPAELAERASDLNMAETTEAEEAEAVQNIIEDYLILGWTYPRRGQRVADAGAFLRDRLDEDETDAALRALLYGCREPLTQQTEYLERICRAELPAWLRKHFQDLIAERAQEMRDDK